MDAASRQLQPQGVGESLQGIFAGVVGAAVGHRHEPQHRAVLDDTAVALPAHHRDDAAGELVGAEQVGLELRPQHLPAQILHRSRLPVGAVVEQGVEGAPGPLQDALHGLPDGGRVIQIQLQ